MLFYESAYFYTVSYLNTLNHLLQEKYISNVMYKNSNFILSLFVVVKWRKQLEVVPTLSSRGRYLTAGGVEALL